MRSTICHNRSTKSLILVIRGYIPKDIARKAAGRVGEQIAADFIVKKGYSLIERNYRKPWGEIDIIAEKGGVVRFVEVKTLSTDFVADVSRENNSYRPEEQVHPWKLRKVARTAETYMNAKMDSREYQIDVVGVFLNMQTRKARCRLFEQVL
jgi:putative endonuclease